MIIEGEDDVFKVELSSKFEIEFWHLFERVDVSCREFCQSITLDNYALVAVLAPGLAATQAKVVFDVKKPHEVFEIIGIRGQCAAIRRFTKFDIVGKVVVELVGPKVLGNRAAVSRISFQRSAASGEHAGREKPAPRTISLCLGDMCADRWVAPLHASCCSPMRAAPKAYAIVTGPRIQAG